MTFFKKESKEKSDRKTKKSLQEIPLPRVLTAEGWRRRSLPILKPGVKGAKNRLA